MKIKNFAIIITLFSVFLPSFFISPAYAQSTIQQNYKTVCGDKFSDPSYQQTYKNLQDAQNYDLQNPQPDNVANPAQGTQNQSNLLQAGCPPSLQDISTVVIRIITIILTVTGLFAFINIVRASFLIMTAGSNKDKVKNGRTAFQNSIIGILVIIMSYTLIVFIAQRLGLADNADNFSILDGGKLIFRFLFQY